MIYYSFDYYNIKLNVCMSAYQVNKRHAFLQQLTGLVKDEEVTSFQNMNTCVTTVTTCVLVFSLLEVISYYLYLFKV